jgi:hypothetical protein
MKLWMTYSNVTGGGLESVSESDSGIVDSLLSSKLTGSIQLLRRGIHQSASEGSTGVGVGSDGVIEGGDLAGNGSNVSLDD